MPEYCGRRQLYDIVVRFCSKRTMLMKRRTTLYLEHFVDVCAEGTQQRSVDSFEPYSASVYNRAKRGHKLLKLANSVISETLCPEESKNLDLVVAASYGGRWDILQAAKKLDSSGTEEQLSSLLSTNKFQDPDLCIRTGNEFRISNFLLWQLAYSELYFPDILWPDFDSNQFQIALDEYSRRSRRFGDTSNFQKS